MKASTQDAAHHILGSKRKLKWLEANGQGRRAVGRTLSKSGVWPPGPHPAADMGKESRQRSFQFLGKAYHGPVIMATEGRPCPLGLNA